MTQMLINNLWFADIVTDRLSSDQVDHANEKVPSWDRIGLNYGFWCYTQDTEHSDLQHRWKTTYRGRKVPNLSGSEHGGFEGSLECFIFWIKRKTKKLGLVILGYLRIRNRQHY